MNIQDALAYFDLLTDKSGSPYFTEAEKSVFLDDAQNQYFESFFFPDSVAETNKRPVEKLSRLTAPLKALTITNDVIDADQIDTSISTYYGGDINNINYKVLNLFVDGKECRFIRYNDLPRFERNVFKRPTEERPYYNFISSIDLDENRAQNITVYPKETFTTADVTVVTSPRKMEWFLLNPTVELDFDNESVYKIIAMAVSLSGVSTYDKAMVELNQAVRV